MASLPSLIFVVPRIATLTGKTHQLHTVTTHSWVRRGTRPTCTPLCATPYCFLSCITFSDFRFCLRTDFVFFGGLLFSVLLVVVLSGDLFGQSHRFLNLDFSSLLSGLCCPSHRFFHSRWSFGNSLRCCPCCKRKGH